MGLVDLQSRKRRTLHTSTQQSSLLFWTTVLITIAVLLAIVGTLQYQWSDEIRQAAEVRLGTLLESTMMKWHLDFYSEISAVCTALQIGPDSGARDRREDYLQRYAQWSRAANHDGSTENIYANPELVKDVYIWETSTIANPELLRLNPKKEKIERSPTPQDLHSLLAHLRRNSSSLRVALHAWQQQDAPNQDREHEERLLPSHILRGDAVAGWQFDERVPAIVHPVLRRHASPSKPTEDDDDVDWVVVVLNSETIEKQILPRLARRYFSNRQGLEFKVAVVTAGGAPRVLYSSDSDFVARDVRSSDAVMNIFGSSGTPTRQLWQLENYRESLHREDWYRFSSPVWFPVIRNGSDLEPWLLVLRSRTGPLNAAVIKAWRNHLFTSGVVLLVLAASIVLVVVASRRAEALANLQMDFVTSISHELRTPLAAILSAGQNITDGFAADLKLYGWLITSQARQQIDLVDQILLFASSKNGAKNCVLRSLQVADVFEHVHKETATLFERSGFTMDFDIAPSLPPILADSRSLSRCLQNLIGNAAKYSGQSRWIGVSAELEEVGGSHQSVRISVADRGIGISSSDLLHIFEPFYRSSSVVATQIHGTGLGLSVTKHLVESMGGRVTVRSEPRVGSVFTLHFRVAHATDSELVA